jgi:hypothetical protein
LSVERRLPIHKNDADLTRGGILEESKVKAHARALEAAQQKVLGDDPARVEARPVALASAKGPQPRGLPFLQLTTSLRVQLLEALDGAVVPASVGADSVDMAAFATTVPATRFYVAGEVVLDGAWRTSQTVQILAAPGLGPPAGAPGPRVHWRLVDRLGERRSSGMVTWAPAFGAPPAIEVTIDQPGRWTVAIEIVDRGQVIAAIEKPLLARSAAETGNDVPALLAGNDLAASAEAMSDPQVGDQLGLLRAQMGKHRLGSLKPGDQVAAGARRVIDEDNLRYALKAEFREAFFACAAREPTAEARMARFRDLTKDLNPKDRSNLVEDFLARRDPGSVQQVAVKQADHPHLGLTAKERHIDRVRPDGTAVEVKSIKGRLSADDLAQFADYQKIVKGEVTVQVAGKPMKIKRAMYEFTEPAGVRANLTTIREKMLDQGVPVKVYNQTGHARILERDGDLVGIEEWLAR